MKAGHKIIGFVVHLRGVLQNVGRFFLNEVSGQGVEEQREEAFP
jgi:hypothetical protein